MLHPDILARADHDLPRAAIGYACAWEKGTTNEPHSHWRGQLIYAISGSLKVISTAGTWIVPPERAVWMPSHTEHSVMSVTDAHARFLYLDPKTFKGLPSIVTVVQMTALMRECLLSFLTLPRLYDEAGSASHLVAIMVDELRVVPVMPLHLPQPASPKLKRAADLVLSSISTPPRLASLAADAGLSVRSFERHFQRETGLTWRKWVTQARLMEAISQLSNGARVGDVAFALGYEGPSAFVAMFKKATGHTPGKYFAPVQPRQYQDRGV
ncbi:helix-turn-helix domain-containing protein [Pararhizobium sp. IMCC21322]|uniref:AraC family transcriptional regulator n=1 Tax=Pararhizobium sp. IMCC21322 TaxID=3067903 RepID=UPI002741F6C0|nr:helix-turn-helix transcriptional regulator [Pararhizobium sp. IMCC21322]